MVSDDARTFPYIHTAFQVHWEASDVSTLTVWTVEGGPIGAVTSAPDPTVYPYTDPLVLTMSSDDAEIILHRGDGRRIGVSVGSLVLLLLPLVVSILQ